MPTNRVTAGFRNFSTAKETTYNGGADEDTAFNFEGAITDIEVNNRADNGDEVTSLNEASEDTIINYKLEGSHTQRANPHNISQFIGMVLGQVTDDQPDVVGNAAVYRHWFERDLTNVALDSFAMVEHDGIAAKVFTGIFGKSLKISGERDGFVALDFGFGGSGQEASSSDVKATVTSESYLTYGDIDFTRGGTISGTVALGTLAVGSSPTSFSSDLKSFEYNIDNDAQPIYEMSDATGYVTRIERGDKFIQSLTTTFEMQDDSHKTGLTAGTEYVLNIPMIGSSITGTNTDGTQYYTVDLIFPKAVYMEAKKTRDGETVLVEASWKILEDSTYGSVIVKTINKQAAYLT